MRARDTDPQAIQEIFNTTQFDMLGWLGSLSPEALSEYAASLEKKGTTTSQIQAIADRVPIFMNIKDSKTNTIMKLLIVKFEVRNGQI